MKIFLIGITFIFICNFLTFSQNKVDTTALKNLLTEIHERDQGVRKSYNPGKLTSEIDSENLRMVDSIISIYGWPGKSFVGGKGNYTIWLVIQHADLKTQEKYLPIFRKSVAEGESRNMDLAYLEDRIMMRKGKNQIYGTQVFSNGKTGMQEFWPIEDEKNVNKRRAEIGLGTIEEYAKNFGIEYVLPK
jgi:hypothetical protein